ncbi:MAG: OmpA family protein [Campylobacterota bacterium]|nr:OmpA family protein [Campylobacterota bacterium]
MKKFMILTVLGLVSLYGAKIPEYEVRPNVSGVVFENSHSLDNGYTYGVDFAKKINNKYMANFSFKRKIFDYENDLGSTFVNIFALNAEYYYYEKGDIQSYITAGLSYLDINKELADADDMLGFNYGIGAKYLINDDAGLFAEIKHLTTFDEDENQFIYTFGVLIPFGYEANPLPAVPVVDEDLVFSQKAEAVTEVSLFPNDDDRDGVTNDRDKCPDSDLRYEVDEDGCTISYTLHVNFEFDSSVLTEDSMGVIKEFSIFMDEPKKLNVEIQGHTDSRGTDKYNQKLSERRAKAVYDALVSTGISKDRLKYLGYGEKQLLVIEDGTVENFAKNRRVQAVILKDK